MLRETQVNLYFVMLELISMFAGSIPSFCWSNHTWTHFGTFWYVLNILVYLCCLYPIWLVVIIACLKKFTDAFDLQVVEKHARGLFVAMLEGFSKMMVFQLPWAVAPLEHISKCPERMPKTLKLLGFRPWLASGLGCACLRRLMLIKCVLCLQQHGREGSLQLQPLQWHWTHFNLLLWCYAGTGGRCCWCQCLHPFRIGWKTLHWSALLGHLAKHLDGSDCGVAEVVHPVLGSLTSGDSTYAASGISSTLLGHLQTLGWHFAADYRLVVGFGSLYLIPAWKKYYKPRLLTDLGWLSPLIKLVLAYC